MRAILCRFSRAPARGDPRLSFTVSQQTHSSSQLYQFSRYAALRAYLPLLLFLPLFMCDQHSSGMLYIYIYMCQMSDFMKGIMCHAQSSSILEAHAGGLCCCHVSASVLSKVLNPEDSGPRVSNGNNSTLCYRTSSDQSQLL